MRTLTVLLFFVAIAASGVAAAESPVKETSGWFPFEKGATSIQEETSGTKRTKIRLETLARETVFGRSAVPVRSSFSDRKRVRYWTEDETGIYIFASAATWDSAPLALTEPIYFLRFPVEVGRTWNETFFLSTSGVRVPTTARITSLSESVTTPAGKFTNCIRVDRTGTLPDPEIANWTHEFRDVTVICRGYGVVWSETIESEIENVRGEARRTIVSKDTIRLVEASPRSSLK